MKYISLEEYDNFEYQDNLYTYFFPDIQLTLVLSTPFVPSISTSTIASTLLTLVKCRRGRPQKYPIQANLFI